MIKITVPATSANLGIGYDTLGMAVSLYSHFTFERADKLTITGCPEEFQNEDNLVYVSFVDALAAWGEPAFPVAIDIQTDVPVARGLGSSSTCVVAGIMAAAALTGHTVDRAELVRIATEVEGHPDNVAPAILGGAVCSFTPTDSLPQCLRYEVSDRLRFITVIPPYEVHTSEARKVVPQEVPLSTAVWQMGRIAGMTRGLESGNLDLIAAANDDRIQEPYRRRLIPDYNAVRDTCLNGGKVPAGQAARAVPQVRHAYPHVRHGRRPDRIPVVAVPHTRRGGQGLCPQIVLGHDRTPAAHFVRRGSCRPAERFGGKAPGLLYVNFAGGGYRDPRFEGAPG